MSPRWAGSGWTIFDNKGRPVRQYEPFFSATSGFEFAAQTGVSTVAFYDPPGRVVATLHPDSSWAKAAFGPWAGQQWDGNDTVLVADPRTDADVGNYFQRLLGTGPFTSWYELRITGTYGATAQDRAAAAGRGAEGRRPRRHARGQPPRLGRPGLPGGRGQRRRGEVSDPDRVRHPGPAARRHRPAGPPDRGIRLP